MPQHLGKDFAGLRVSEREAGASKHDVIGQRDQDSASGIRLGDIYLSQVRAETGNVVRLGQHATGSRSRRYLTHMQLQGSTLVRHVGREARLSAGDLVMCDSALPYTLECGEETSLLIVSAAPTCIKQRLPSPEFVLGKRLAGDSGLATTLSLVISHVWREAQFGMSDDVARRLGATLLDLIATCCMDTFGERVGDAAIGSARRSHVRCHIENSLKDPNLTVASIARAFRISPRYLHMLFADEDETLCEYIRRRRLEECRNQLADPMWMRRSISELAYTWGFNNTTHFARVFRDQYGVSPRDFRSASLGKQERVQV